MEEYEIVYDYCGDASEEYNLVENFQGTHSELTDYIKQMRKDGCYNITANALNQY